MRLRRTQDSRRRFWAGVAAGLLLPLTFVFVWWMEPAMAARPQDAPDSSASAPAALGRAVQVLILGVDERDQVDGSRTDTMLLARIADGQVRLLSIPRDTLVKIEGHDDSKINSAYTYGGADLAKEVTGELLGLPVDYYVKVNLAGFRDLVDLMGGVEYNVPKAMHYVDPTDGTYIDLKPGLQVLNGDKAEQLVRFRHDAIGDDMGRIARQQEFLQAAVSQALTPSRLLKLPQLLYTARSYVETDVPIGEQLRLAQALFGARKSDAVVMETLPGRGDYVDEISFFLVDKAELQRLVSVWEAL
ncbi:MAG TPA: LCP family protein [Symbiobacteriaceae bacterium]|nr:LCP family protein [Symbiobacteriaceae bacterium]